MIGQQMITEARMNRGNRERLAVIPMPNIHRHDNSHVHTFFLSILRPLSDFIDRLRMNH